MYIKSRGIDISQSIIPQSSNLKIIIVIENTSRLFLLKGNLIILSKTFTKSKVT